ALARPRHIQREQPIGLANAERTEEQRVRGAEDRGVGAGADANRQQGDAREPGRWGEQSRSVPDVLPQIAEYPKAPGLTRAFDRARDAAELGVCDPVRVCWRQTALPEI